MIKIKLRIALFLFAVTSILHAQQQQPPFTVTLSGGLFFPAKENFQQIYRSNSDIIWSVGTALPVGNNLFLVGEYGKFTSSGFFNASTDSGAQYDERIIHAGLLDKQPLSGSILLRISGGINRVTVRQTTTRPNTPDVSIETGTLYGFFGAAGIETSFGEPHLSLYADAVYDYSRFHDKNFGGDYGGLRIALGVNIILF